MHGSIRSDTKVRIALYKIVSQMVRIKFVLTTSFKEKMNMAITPVPTVHSCRSYFGPHGIFSESMEIVSYTTAEAVRGIYV